MALKPKLLGMVTICSGAVFLTGCMQAPTYGTGKRSDVQLLEDFGNMMAIAPTPKEQIIYKPRAELVTPPSTDVLPVPQASVKDQSGVWPESPEERRARVRDEITANQDNPLYRSPIQSTGLGEVNTNGELTREEQRERFRAGRAVQSGAYTERRLLSDPPSEYKLPAETAALDDLGEAEKVKERRRLREARKASGTSGLRSLWPW